jgi:hypothetical protein
MRSPYPKALQRRHPGQEHFSFDQTRRGQTAQDTEPLRTEPGAAKKPPDQTKHLAGIMKIAITTDLLNLSGMIPVGIARVVVLQTCGVLQA